VNGESSREAAVLKKLKGVGHYLRDAFPGAIGPVFIMSKPGRKKLKREKEGIVSDPAAGVGLPKTEAGCVNSLPALRGGSSRRRSPRSFP